MALELNRRQFVWAILAIETSSALVAFALVGSTVGPGVGLLVAVGILAAPFILLPAVMFLLSFLTGWRTLARRYPGAHEGFEEPRPTIPLAIRRRWLGYNGGVEFRADEHTLRLRLPPWMAAGHHPIAIPWAAVHEIDTTAPAGTARLDVEGVPLWLPRKAVQNEVRLRAEMASEGLHNEQTA